MRQGGGARLLSELKGSMSPLVSALDLFHFAFTFAAQRNDTNPRNKDSKCKCFPFCFLEAIRLLTHPVTFKPISLSLFVLYCVFIL